MVDKNMNDKDIGIKIYETAGNEVKLDVKLDGVTIWLTQKQIAFYEDATCSILEHTTIHGAIMGKTQRAKTKYYNLDMIIALLVAQSDPAEKDLMIDLIVNLLKI